MRSEAGEYSVEKQVKTRASGDACLARCECDNAASARVRASAAPGENDVTVMKACNYATSIARVSSVRLMFLC